VTSSNASLEHFDFIAIQMVFGGHVLWLASVPRVANGPLSCRDLAHEAIRLSKQSDVVRRFLEGIIFLSP
jgi:hypothetical protein